MATIQNNVIKMPDLDYKPDPRGIGYTFYEGLKKYHDLIAQIDDATGKFETFGTLLEDSLSTAVKMRSLDIKAGEVVSLCSYNQLDCIKVFIATFFLGSIIASFDPNLCYVDTVHLMGQIKPKMIFVSENAIEMIQKSINETTKSTQIIMFGEYDGFIPFSEFLGCETENFKPVEITNPKETAVIIFSSGTTGKPKGICLTHYGIVCQSYTVNNVLVRKGEDRKYTFNGVEAVGRDPTLSFASFYWISTIILSVASALDGFMRVVAKRFNPNLAWEIMVKYSVNTMFVAPSQLVDLMVEKPEDADTSTLKDLAVGGSSIAEERVLMAREVFPFAFINQCCGQTEVAGLYSIFKHDDPEAVALMTKNPKSCGRPVPGFTYKFLDLDTGEILGPNQPGELRVKSDFQMSGYYEMDSSDAVDEEGFVISGDVLYYDEDLCFYHVDRIKEMLKYRSFHVAPATLESILVKHPEVFRAVVVGLPHPEDGDHPLAFVIRKKNSAVTAEEILEFVHQRVDDTNKLRGGVYFVEEFPMTPTGKIRRKALKEMAISLKSA